MESKTTILVVGPTIYIRIPPEYRQHLGIETGEGGLLARIRSEVNKNGKPYCSIWKEGN